MNDSNSDTESTMSAYFSDFDDSDDGAADDSRETAMPSSAKNTKEASEILLDTGCSRDMIPGRDYFTGSL